MAKKGSILVVDDEEVMRDVLDSLLTAEGYTVELAKTGEEGLDKFQHRSFDLVLLDVSMPGMGGLRTLEEILKLDAEAVVAMITAYATFDTAISAMQRGAFTVISKPFDNDEILKLVASGMRRHRKDEERRTLRQTLKRSTESKQIVARSENMLVILAFVEQVAPARTTILITGESGTGKELIARAIHNQSARSDKPFVTVNSANLPTELLESELFGHIRGAFTGAVAAKKGYFEVADGGSIFLDEIGTISMETQAKLLRVLQEKEFMRVGSVDTQKVDTRVIAATNVDLKKWVAEGRFRDDLYYRLCVITIQIPPLRDRREDIPLLAEHFMRVYASENQKPIGGLDPEAYRALLDHDWPGNVRELENAIERAVVLCPPGGKIGLGLLPESVLSPDRGELPIRLPENGATYKQMVEEYERRLIRTALRRTGGVQKRAAEMLKIKPTTLHEIIKRLEIRE